MGICSSCLGFSRKDDPERQGLLSGDQNNYNAHGYMSAHYPTSSGNQNSHIPDRQTLILEREYLERIVAQTSEHLIDIFAAPTLTNANSSTTPNTRGQWYRDLLDKTSPPDSGPEMPVVLDPGVVGKSERDWLENVLKSGEEAVKEVGKVTDVGRLVVGLEYDS